MNCERCNKQIDGTFGSGRFCNRSCANVRVLTQDYKDKISNTQKQTAKGFCVSGFNKNRITSVETKKLLSKIAIDYYKNFENRKKLSVSLKNSEKRKLSQSRPEYKLACSIRAKENGFGGKRNSKKFYYKGVCLDSSYELAVAKDLDKNGILWERPKRIKYFDRQNIYHYYLSDFYLPQYNIYLDPKNSYLLTKDVDKIRLVSEQNHIKILMLSCDELGWNKIKDKIGLLAQQ